MASVAIYTARTGLDTAQAWLNNIAQSAANINSLAYKDSMLGITDLSYTQLKSSGVQSAQDTFERPVGIQRGSGSKVVSTTKVLTQGPLKQTGNPLDIAIRGSGYFAVNLPNGVTGYTRAGAFQRNKTGQITTVQGYELDGITIDTKYNLSDIEIAEDGTITVDDNSTGTPTLVTLGQIPVWIFPNEQGVQDIGEAISLATEASGTPVSETANSNNAGALEQKSLEMSNVTSVEVMTNLIEAYNVSELATKVISTVDDVEKNINNMYKG